LPPQQVLAAVCYCNLSSFSSISPSCFLGAAISAAAEPADSALAREPANIVTRERYAIFVPCLTIPIEAPHGWDWNRDGKRRMFASPETMDIDQYSDGY
jgi:hypothetical protein